jgi:hypothetical protein
LAVFCFWHASCFSVRHRRFFCFYQTTLSL